VKLLDQLKQMRLVPVIVIEHAQQAEGLADALVQGGLPCAEVTFRTAAAGDALKRIAKKHPDMLVGAGTVLTPQQARSAREAGAKFIVAPGFNATVVDYCQANEIPVFPGVCTPTEIEMALSKGLKTVKFFPAEPIGGLNYLKAIAAPYGDVDFIPTGGITTKNVHEYLAFKKVIACGGSWMAPADAISAGDFARIENETRRAVEAVRSGAGVAP
jgi:2-dehydro-3-deoxyphosphogluconate aldolase / (4S)-4-hydroxy-2-oxoglutarate aldolase